MNRQNILNRFASDLLVLIIKEHDEYIKSLKESCHEYDYFEYEIKDELLRQVFIDKPERFTFDGYQFIKYPSCKYEKNGFALWINTKKN